MIQNWETGQKWKERERIFGNVDQSHTDAANSAARKCEAVLTWQHWRWHGTSVEEACKNCTESWSLL